VEKALVCTYEAVKPRQRKKRDSVSDLVACTPLTAQFDEENDIWQQCDQTDEVTDEACTSVVDILQDDPTAEVLLSPTTSSVFDFSQECTSDENDHLALVRRGSDSSTASNALSLPPDLAVISPCPLASPSLGFSIPAFSEFSDRPNRRALVNHFCNVLSHLIVFREESGNPWQQLVLPLSYNNSPVMNAIYALAGAHLEYRGVDTGEKSIYFHNEAIQGLAELIEGNRKVNHRNELLAAIMLLVYYEVVSLSHCCLPSKSRTLTVSCSWYKKDVQT
jgi:hypothetical protein